MSDNPPGKPFVVTLQVLLILILGLMALGAGVRTMNAGLSCPDWPLCFGTIVPDFHPGVWLEHAHRIYAGLVALVYLYVYRYVMSSRAFSAGAKRAAVLGLLTLVAQIAVGALTVFLQVQAEVVTLHLVLATVIFSSVLWIYFQVRAVPQMGFRAPWGIGSVSLLICLGVFAQITLGGLVASTYAGSVCMDWPLCNGQWIPTWEGAIGLQVMHRFFAYGLVVVIGAFVLFLHLRRGAMWITPQLLKWSRMNLLLVSLQIGVGAANLLLFIPPWLTIVHQTLAILLLATNLRIFHITSNLVRGPGFEVVRRRMRSRDEGMVEQAI